VATLRGRISGSTLADTPLNTSISPVN